MQTSSAKERRKRRSCRRAAFRIVQKLFLGLFLAGGRFLAGAVALLALLRRRRFLVALLLDRHLDDRLFLLLGGGSFGFGRFIGSEIFLRILDGRNDIGDRLGRVALERGDLPFAKGAVVLIHAAALSGHLVFDLGLIGNGICLFAGNSRYLLRLLGGNESDVLDLLAEVIEKCHSNDLLSNPHFGLLL